MVFWRTLCLVGCGHSPSWVILISLCSQLKWNISGYIDNTSEYRNSWNSLRSKRTPQNLQSFKWKESPWTLCCCITNILVLSWNSRSSTEPNYGLCFWIYTCLGARAWNGGHHHHHHHEFTIITTTTTTTTPLLPPSPPPPPWPIPTTKTSTPWPHPHHHHLHPHDLILTTITFTPMTSSPPSSPPPPWPHSHHHCLHHHDHPFYHHSYQFLPVSLKENANVCNATSLQTGFWGFSHHYLLTTTKIYLIRQKGGAAFTQNEGFVKKRRRLERTFEVKLVFFCKVCCCSSFNNTSVDITNPTVDQSEERGA